MQKVLVWSGLTEVQQTAWTEYRNALKDVPEQEIFVVNPLSVEWPTKPEK